MHTCPQTASNRPESLELRSVCAVHWSFVQALCLAGIAASGLIGCDSPSTGHTASLNEAVDAGADAGADAGPAEVEVDVVELDLEVDVQAEFDSTFLGSDDSAWRRSLAEAGWGRMERGSGGRSLGFKVTLVNGTAGYFKPAQAFAGARWYSEVAAYHIDRELGLDRVPPTVGRRFPLRALERAAPEDPRLEGLEVDDEGWVAGAFIGWVPQRLVRWRIGPGFERQLRFGRVDLLAHPAHSPFQPPRDWRDVVNGIRLPEDTALGREPPAAELSLEELAEASDLIVFDTLIHNVDRWGGDYTNVRRRGRGGPLIYLDNGAGFWEGELMLGLAESRLHAIQKFRRSTIESLEALDLDRLRARMASDPLGPPLTDERHWEGIEFRRQAILEHVRTQVARHGDGVFL